MVTSVGSAQSLRVGSAHWLLHATPHKWGPGKVHIWVVEDGSIFDPAERNGHTLCGMRIEQCPGNLLVGTVGDETCQRCVQSRDKEIRWAEREAERAAEHEEWWRRYNEYMASPQWRERSRLVLERANYVCEGCGKARAVHAHHLTYDRFGDEMLFDLRAVCRECHSAIHGREI